MTSSTSTFLTARWHYLAMLNYEVDPAILRSRVPAGTALDTSRTSALERLAELDVIARR